MSIIFHLSYFSTSLVFILLLSSLLHYEPCFLLLFVLIRRLQCLPYYNASRIVPGLLFSALWLWF
jgi:hypothetical protein